MSESSDITERAEMSTEEAEEPMTKECSTQTDLVMDEVEILVSLKDRVANLEKKLDESQFRLCNIMDNDSKVTFYTGFPSFSTLKAFYTFLGPSVNHLKYSKKQEQSDIESGIENKRLRPRTLPPLEELFMTLVRLRLGLVKQDLAYQFGVSQSTVSRVTCT